MDAIPQELRRLLEIGVWPSTKDAERAQTLKPLVPKALIRSVFPDEETIYFLSPPFMTIAERIGAGDTFFASPTAAIHQLDASLALDIASFGPGSDGVVALDFRHDKSHPSVIQLQWSADGASTSWVTVFESFADFCSALKIGG